MKKTIAIVGGDLRIVKLAKMLTKENTVIVYGLEKAEELQHNNEIVFAKSLKHAIEQADMVIGPMPFSRDGKNVLAPFSDNEIAVQELLEKAKNKKLIAGSISLEIQKKARENNIQIIDLMDYEELTVLNTIATAEGAIQVAMEKTQKTIQGSKVLILGFGRVGKATAHKFKALLSEVTCAARKEEDFAWIEVYWYNKLNINEMDENLGEYDIIINTVPKVILTKEKLKYVKKDCLIIDLASKPGGVDVEAVKEMNINFDWALALPGKVAPTTSAEYIKNIIEKL